MNKEVKSYIAYFAHNTKKIVGSSFKSADLLKAFESGKLSLSDNSIYKGNEKIRFAWIDEFENVVNKIATISRDPRTHIRVYKDIINSEAAVKIDNNDVVETMKESQLWKEDEYGEYRPEYVYTDTYDTDVAIFENRFVCFLLDLMKRFLNNTIKDIYSMVRYLDGRFMANYIAPSDVKTIYSFNEYTDFFFDERLTKKKEKSNESPLLTLETAPYISLLKRLTSYNRIISHIMSTRFYQSVKKARRFSDTEVRSTNLLKEDKNYNPCFKFYFQLKKLIGRRVNDEFISIVTYKDYVTLNLLLALSKFGFDIHDTFSFDSSYHLKNTSFSGKKGRIYLDAKLINSDINLCFYLNKNAEDDNKKYENNICLHLVPNKPVGYVSNNEIKNEYLEFIDRCLNNGFQSVYIVTPHNKFQNDDILICSPFDYRIGVTFMNMIRSSLLFTNGDSFLYNRICPVCGSKMDGEDDDGNCHCYACRSVYACFDQKDGFTNQTVWFKRIKNQR